jgi:hypothetical protein
MGRFCHICKRVRANERFSGKGYRDHLCKDCARLPSEARARIETLDELDGMLHQSHISPKNRTRLQSLTTHADPEIARAAAVLLDLAKLHPRRRRRMVQLRRNPDLVRRLITELPPGVWEGYMSRFHDSFDDPYQDPEDFDFIIEDHPPHDPGPDPDPDEPIRWEDCISPPRSRR